MWLPFFWPARFPPLHRKLLLAYDDARRAVTPLRGAKGDVDTIAPSFFPGRLRPKKDEAQVPPALSLRPLPDTQGERHRHRALP